VELAEYLKIFNSLVDTIVGIGPYLLGTNVFQDGLSLPGVIPKIVLVGNAFLVFYLYSLAIVVKDTSLGRRCGPLNLSVVPKSSIY